MTAVCLKVENSLKTETWSNIFTGFNTGAKSYLFIKQLTNTCISTVLYLRKVLPDDYFEEKTFEGMTLKLLKPRKGENYVSKIEQWLEGAFEAMEKHYVIFVNACRDYLSRILDLFKPTLIKLKRLMLDIQDAESNMTLEIYTMTFNYNEEKEGLNGLVSTTSSCTKSDFSTTNTKLNTIKLLQMCQAVTQTYSDLPSQVKLSMRLSYYENTPEDYQPRGYIAWEAVDPQFPRQARSIEIGVTSTQHHFFKFFNKSCLSDKFFKDLEDQLEGNNSTLLIDDRGDVQNSGDITQERQTKAKRELCFDNPKKCLETSLSVIPKAETKFIVTEKCTSVSKNQSQEYKLLKNESKSKIGVATNKQFSKKIPIKGDGTRQKVRCACLSPDKTETMFPCLGCGFFAHAECYGVLQFDSTKRVRFYCHLCHQIEKNFKCHDKVIMSLRSSLDQQKLSLLRRVLQHCNKPDINKITLKKVEKILGSSCPTNVVIIVFNKMIEIGIAVAQGKRKSYLIDKQMLSNKLVQYFYKVQNFNQNQTQAFPYSLRTLENIKRKNNPDAFLLNKRSRHLTTAMQDFTCNSQTSQQSCDIFC